MTRNIYLEEDFERESLQDYIYLCEREKEIEQEYYEYINRLPGEIIVIDKRKNKKENDNIRIFQRNRMDRSGHMV